MLTSYLVKCPHAGCDWFGSLLPRGENGSMPLLLPGARVSFQCPHCQGEWRARVVGDDVEPIEVLDTHAAGV